MAKILRLRKQQRLLDSREQEMARRGLRFFDELDAVEEKERLENENAEKLSEQIAPKDSTSYSASGLTGSISVTGAGGVFSGAFSNNEM